ncbi:STM4014 family protein [Nonomuraea sp. NPDC003727]
MTYVVVGTPGDRRVTMFAAALTRYGLRPPQVVAWPDVLAGQIAIPPGARVRIDSPGEDTAADALLRGPGAPTRVGGGALWHSRLVAGLARVADAASAAGARVLGDVGEIAEMFDKRRTHARLAAAGVPVPAALGPAPVGGYADLRRLMADRGMARVFVKPAHGSSASGVVAFQTNGSLVKATTSVEPAGGELHNSLRVRDYHDETTVAAIVDALAPDGLHVEEWFPKAAVGGRVFDLRVVVVAGRPTHAVVRTSRAPMTNLHLGGARGSLETVMAALGPAGWARALEICARAAACFPRSPAVGVDLMVGAGLRRFAVAEVNAFGDLLPGLTGLPGSGAEGLDTYETQVRAYETQMPRCQTRALPYETRTLLNETRTLSCEARTLPYVAAGRDDEVETHVRARAGAGRDDEVEAGARA